MSNYSALGSVSVSLPADLRDSVIVCDRKYEPQKDITAYELAMITKLVMCLPGQMVQDQDRAFDAWAAKHGVDRHFAPRQKPAEQRIFVSSKLKAKMEACDEVVDHRIHYAPYGRNALNKFDCGSAVGGYTDNPSVVTCEECKKLSPGLWPPEETEADFFKRSILAE